MEAKKLKVQFAVPIRQGHRGVYALGRLFEAGNHQLEVTEAELAALKVREGLGCAVAVEPEPAKPEPKDPPKDEKSPKK